MIIVDRIEKDIAVCEDNGEFINISINNIIGNLHEGAVLIKTESGYLVDEDLTFARKKIIFDKQKKLFNI